jgi:hypothetical protein
MSWNGHDLPGSRRHFIFDGGDGDRLRFRECVPADGRQSGDGPGWRNLSQACAFAFSSSLEAFSAATFSCSWRSSGDSHDRRSASQMFAQKRPTVSLSSVELTSDVGVRANPRIGVLAMMESTWAFCRSL